MKISVLLVVCYGGGGGGRGNSDVKKCSVIQLELIVTENNGIAKVLQARL